MDQQPVQKEVDKFNLKYFLAGEGKKDWFKAWGAGYRLVITIVIIILLIAGFVAVKNAIFPLKGNVSKPIYIGLPGSTNVNTTNTTQTVVNPKRPWWMPIPYISAAGVAQGTASNNFTTGVKVEAGVRLDFW